MPVPPPGTVKHVVIMVQENHTTDNYMRGLAAYGANVATGWPVAVNPPTGDQPHDRNAYFQWLTHQITGAHVQFDTLAVLPLYAYLAATGAFLENHCAGFGTNSTPNHLLLVGGQSPTLRNPPRTKPAPLWDMPSVPGLAADHGVSWRAYTGRSQYPVDFYTRLKGSPNIVSVAQFATDAQAGALPALSYIWHDSPLDEHPPANVTLGMNAIWQAVERIPRLDGDAGLADLVDPARSNPPPPAFGTTITMPPPPQPTPAPQPLPPPPPGPAIKVPRIILRNGKTLPPPNDAPLPKQPPVP